MRRFRSSYSAYNYRAVTSTKEWYCKEYTFSEMLEASLAAKKEYPNELGAGSGSTSFYGSESYEQTVEFARKGNDIVTDRVRKLVERISGTFSFTSTCDYMMDVTGQTLDIGTLLTGNPECWLMPVETKSLRSDKLIEISTELGFSGATDKEHIEFRGAMIASLVDALRQRGFSVKLSVTHCGSNINFVHEGKSYSGFSTKTNLINYGELPDLSLIAFYLADVSCYRRLQFALWNGFTHRANSACHCNASEPPEHFRSKFHIDSSDGLFRVGSYITDKEIALAQEWLSNKLKLISETY